MSIQVIKHYFKYKKIIFEMLKYGHPSLLQAEHKAEMTINEK